jgi:hypothetical protein
MPRELGTPTEAMVAILTTFFLLYWAWDLQSYSPKCLLMGLNCCILAWQHLEVKKLPEGDYSQGQRTYNQGQPCPGGCTCRTVSTWETLSFHGPVSRFFPLLNETLVCKPQA